MEAMLVWAPHPDPAIDARSKLPLCLELCGIVVLVIYGVSRYIHGQEVRKSL